MKQIKINVPDGYELRKEGNIYTVMVKEKRDFVKGKDYVHSFGAIMIDVKSNNPSIENGFGSIEGGFCRLNVYNREDWREATEEEVIEAFEKECVRKLGEDWRESKLKGHANGESVALNKSQHLATIKKTEDQGWIVWNKNGLVYCEGNWAEKLEEPKFAENLEDIDRPWYVSTFGNIVKVSEEAYEEVYQDKNHLPTQELSEGTLALIQLLSFRHDVWEKEGKPDDVCWVIKTTIKGGLEVFQRIHDEFTFSFKKEETAEWFLKTHRKLLIEYFNKLVR